MNKNIVSLMFSAAVVCYFFTVLMGIATLVDSVLNFPVVSYRIICLYGPIMLGVYLLYRFDLGNPMIIGLMLFFISSLTLCADVNNVYHLRGSRNALSLHCGMMAVISTVMVVYSGGLIATNTHRMLGESKPFALSYILQFALMAIIFAIALTSNLWKFL
jgi:hypothetical protein